MTDTGKKGLFRRLREKINRGDSWLTRDLGELVGGRAAIDDELLEELETRLLTADVGMEATTGIIEGLESRISKKAVGDVDALLRALREEMLAILAPCQQPLVPDAGDRPFVILTVGVNGVGKTTTIGKIAHQLHAEGRDVVLAAGDTFRAAAVEQLEVWGERVGVPVVSQHYGADSAAVIHDAMARARSRNSDVLLADTAGRLHTQGGLMEELRKVRRVIARQDETAPHEVLLVVDGGTGQNALAQLREFNQAVNVTGLAVTKLDGTARGGILLAMAKQHGIPIRYIGVGESVEDLQPFDAEAFVDALIAPPETDTARSGESAG